MAKPVIWTVDDDADVLRAVERDLRRHYGDRYKVISADSGVSALDATKQLKLRNEPVALFLVDPRMPRMSGVEFLEKTIELYPDAKRALLTAYADTDAAIRAINNAHIDHYLMKPWDPPEERLYGVVDDMLDDWQASYRPEFQGVRVVGHQWSPRSTEIRDFIGRNFVPHQWLRSRRRAQAGPENESGVSVLRSRCRRRWSVWTGRSGLRRGRWTPHVADRTRSSGRASGPKFAHRKLSRLPDGT